MEDQEMKELEMVIQEKKDQGSQEQEMEVPSTRSYNLLIVLLIVLLGVTVFVAYVNTVQPKWFIDWRDQTLSQLNIQNPFAAPDELIVDPDKIPDGLREGSDGFPRRPFLRERRFVPPLGAAP